MGKIGSLFLFFGGVLIVLSVKAMPWGRHSEADVRVSGEQLLICVPKETKGYVHVRGVVVYETNRARGSNKMMWEVNLKQGGEHRRLEAGACIVYGSELPGYERLVAAKPLKANVGYHAEIEVYHAKPVRQSIMTYSHKFCLWDKSRDKKESQCSFD